MKFNKSLIALCISGVASATVIASEIYNDGVNSIEMGGRAEARMSVQDGEVEDRSRVRLNFTGTAEITDTIYGIGFYEGEFTTNDKGGPTDSDSSDLTNRYAYAGFGTQFGEVTYGKNEGALGVITDFTDIMAYHGNSAAYKIAVADRSDNMLTYKDSIGDLQIKGSYRFADRIEGANGKFDNNDTDGYSMSAIYGFDINGFDINLGLGYADGTEADIETKNQYGTAERDQFMLAGSVAYNDFYFAALYVDGTDEFKPGKVEREGYEVAFSYTRDKAVLTATYNYEEHKDKIVGQKYDNVDNLAFDVTYYFQPNFRGYASYNFNNLSGRDVDYVQWKKEGEAALGLRYDF